MYSLRALDKEGEGWAVIVTILCRTVSRLQFRTAQIQRALKATVSAPLKIKKHQPNDYKRFIKTSLVLRKVEFAERNFTVFIPIRLRNEAIYDGF